MNDAFAHCEAAAKAGARDRWLGALFAPPQARRRLFALIAFELEMAHMRDAVRDPRAGEIRLVWWRETLTGAREAGGHPVATAMLQTLEEVKPPPHLIENAVAGRQFDLYDDPPPSLRDLEAYLGETRSGLLQIAARALGGAEDAAEASGLAGVALGLIELLRAPAARPLNITPPGMDRAGLIAHARRRLEEAEAARAKLGKALAPAYAELATAPLWLDALAREGAPPAAWRRQWALWRWMRRA